jgi:hypothetical protein
MTFQELGHVRFFSNTHIDGDAGIFLSERRVFTDLAIIRKDNAHFMSALTQLPRQSIHDVDKRSGSLQRRSFGADHQDSHG